MANRQLSGTDAPGITSNAISLDMANMPYMGFTTTLDQNINASGISVINVPTGIPASFLWLVTVDGTGGYTWPESSLPTGYKLATPWNPITVASNKILLRGETVDGGTNWLISHTSTLDATISNVAFSANAITLNLNNRALTAITSTLDQNVAISGITISNVPSTFTELYWQVTVDGTGGYTWPASSFPSGTLIANDWAPDLTAAAVVLLIFRTWDGGATWSLSHNSPLALASSSAAGLMSAAQFDKLGLLNEFGSNTNTQTGTSYTVTDSDRGGLVTLNNASAVTVNVDTNAITFAAGERIDFLNLGAGAVTIQGGGTTPVTINKKSSQTAVLSQYAGASLVFTSDTAAVLIGGMDAV